MNISKILDQENVEKNHQLYAAGLLDVVNFLEADLWGQLEDIPEENQHCVWYNQ